MHKLATIIAIPTLLFFGSTIHAENESNPPQADAVKNTSAPFQAFTGKITKNKVRVRLQPNLDSPIIRENNKDDMVIVLGETEDFYAVRPPSDLKTYIYRTFVLDNQVEGSRVNVRLEPNVDAPVVAQLNSGDTVDGVISPSNSKWLEISAPESARFYIAKEFIQNIGDQNLMSRIEKRRFEVNNLLEEATALSQNELQKPFEEINIQAVVNGFQKITQEYPEFSDQSSKAKDLLTSAQDTYIQKKIDYLENNNRTTATVLQNRTSSLTAEIEAQKEKMRQLEQKVTVNSEQQKRSEYVQQQQQIQQVQQQPRPIYGWQSQEQALYDAWARRNNEKTMDDYYKEQAKRAVVIRGVVQPFPLAIKNKPGDYVLVNSNNQTTAYLYSTDLTLQNYVGHEITMHALPRPNNNFAFPAFVVLSIE